MKLLKFAILAIFFVPVWCVMISLGFCEQLWKELK